MAILKTAELLFFVKPGLLEGPCSDAFHFSTFEFSRLQSPSPPSVSSLCSQEPAPMSSQTSGGEVASPSRPTQRTFLDDLVLTFTSPMAWLLVVALIITWSAVAIVLFDLLDYKTLTGNSFFTFLKEILSLFSILPS